MRWPFKKNPVREFWAWFEKNSELFREPPPKLSPATLQKLGALLEAVQPGLVFEFALANGRANEIVISADGDRDLFQTVIDVVKAAPQLNGWKITAFRQPGKLDVTIKVNDLRLRGGDIWFQAKPHNGQTALLLHVRGMTQANHEQLGGAVVLLLDNALGEFAMATAVGAIQFAPLPDDPQSAGLRPFIEIRDAVQLITQ